MPAGSLVIEPPAGTGAPIHAASLAGLRENGVMSLAKPESGPSLRGLAVQRFQLVRRGFKEFVLAEGRLAAKPTKGP